MKFTIDNKIFEKYPDLNIGIVIARGIDNTEASSEMIELLRNEEKRIKQEFNSEILSDQPKIKIWRETYSSFGAKPKKYRCSVENLYRMILEGIELKHINKIVDIYNYISIRHTVPVGGDDVDKVEGDIRLKIANGTEPFIELNSEETKTPKPGEVVYVDDKEVLCRRWNWRECDKSKMTERTKNATIVVEGLPPTTQEHIRDITNELVELIKKYCGGETQIFILNKENSSIEI